MVEKLPQHKHCRVCRKAVLATEDFCDDMCKKEYQESLKKKRNSYLLLLVFAVLLMLMAFTMG
jgi:predicted nucleic acid-binding Zn ribbon protein